LWDNGLTIHRREPFNPESRRLMKRTTIFLSRECNIVPSAGAGYRVISAPVVAGAISDGIRRKLL
jgi:hypothetical protein